MHAAMHRLDYFIVDVFSESALAGNPLAVVMDSAGLDTERMQAIAREFNLSETTFVHRRPAALEQAEGVKVRIFTAHEELPFGGHPTLGTASVLRLNAPEVMQGNTITLALKVGAVPVRFEVDRAFGEMTQREPEFGVELDPDEVARLTGLNERDLDRSLPPQVVSTGTAFAIVALRSSQALEALHVNHREATAWLRQRGARWFYVLAPAVARDKNSTMYRARMQFEGGEDPATGSAAGCAISYLVRRRAVGSDCRVHVRQGVEIARPSDIFLRARTDGTRVTEVRVGGSTVLVATGQLFLP